MRPLCVEFLTELDCRLLHHPPEWANPDRAFALIAPLRVRIGQFELLDIPADFITDFASIPPPFRNLLSPTHAKVGRPAVLHDFLYMVGYRDCRRVCDDLLLSGMVTEGAPAWMREAVYAGVRLGGWVAWDRYRRRSTKELQKNLHSLSPPLLKLTVANWDRNSDGLS